MKCSGEDCSTKGGLTTILFTISVFDILHMELKQKSDSVHPASIHSKSFTSVINDHNLNPENGKTPISLLISTILRRDHSCPFQLSILLSNLAIKHMDQIVDVRKIQIWTLTIFVQVKQDESHPNGSLHILSLFCDPKKEVNCSLHQN